MAVSDFVFTDHMVTVSNQLWMITAAIGACLCFVVLVLIAVVAIHPVSRRHLDRVSFRILTYALIANMAFGIVNAVGGSFAGPTWACGFTIWILQLTLELSSFLIFCIALNMQLVIVHRVNGQKMERFYLVGSLVLSFAVTIPPYAAKQWDNLVQDCWYSNDDPKQRLAWQIGTQLFWTLLTVVGEVCTSLTVIIYMIKHRLKVLHVAAKSATSRSGTQAGSTSRANHQVVFANKYRNVLWRIGLYPLASCVINLTSVMCVIHATVTDGVHNMSGYRILLLSDFLYGGRAVVYALLAATDPSFLSAWRALFAHERSSHSPFPSSSIGTGSRSYRQGNETVIEVELITTTTHHQDNDLPKDRSTHGVLLEQHAGQDTPVKPIADIIPLESRGDAFAARMRSKAELERDIRNQQQEEFKRQI